MANDVQLWIGKGIAPVPGDTGGIETMDDVLDLLTVRGFSVSLDGWTPKVAQVKDGGIYLDNPAIADHFPIALSLGNVQETIKLTSSGSSHDGRYYLQNRLFRLRSAAHAFWLSESQNQPVFLCYQAPGSKGPLYALIYSIDVAPVTDAMVAVNTNELVITIDRECGWSLIPPGANPKWASYIINGTESTWLNSGSSNAALNSGSDHLVQGTCYNRQELDATLYVISTANYIDIPAAKIPGDLPANVCITVEVNDGVGTFDVYIAKSTKPTTVRDRAGNLLPLYNVFPASGSVPQTDTSMINDTTRGIIHVINSANKQIARTTFATTATEIIRLLWYVSSTMPHLNSRVLRGTYAIFVRGSQINGTEGYITMRLSIVSTGNFVVFDSGQKTVEKETAGYDALHYMGMVTLPTNTPETISARGKGGQAEYDFRMELYALRNTATGSASLNITDVIFLPIEEGVVEVAPSAWLTSVSFEPFAHIYDNTGYFTHGKPEAVLTVHGVPAANNEEYVPLSEPKGGQITLDPGVNNRLYFLAVRHDVDPPTADPAAKFDVFIDIVPRWSAGARDI